MFRHASAITPAASHIKLKLVSSNYFFLRSFASLVSAWEILVAPLVGHLNFHFVGEDSIPILLSPQTFLLPQPPFKKKIEELSPYADIYSSPFSLSSTQNNKLLNQI